MSNSDGAMMRRPLLWPLVNEFPGSDGKTITAVGISNLEGWAGNGFSLSISKSTNCTGNTKWSVCHKHLIRANIPQILHSDFYPALKGKWHANLIYFPHDIVHHVFINFRNEQFIVILKIIIINEQWRWEFPRVKKPIEWIWGCLGTVSSRSSGFLEFPTVCIFI